MELLGHIEEELDYRCLKAESIDKQALLLKDVLNFSKIWGYVDGDVYEGIMQDFIKKVESTANVDYHILHTALQLLQQEPLTTCIDDNEACGCRRYEFSIGRNWYQSTLRSWAETQHGDGSWTNVSADEAYGRISVVGSDFGSMDEVDNYRLTMFAYNHYCTSPCNSPRELYDKHQAYFYKRALSYRKMSIPIMNQTMAMLKSQNLTLEDKLYLYSIVL